VKRIRNLALVAVSALALTALVGVAAASASEVVAESYPTTLTTPNPQTQHTLTFNSATAKCEAPSLEGKLSSATKTIAATAKDATCEYFGSPKLKMNGCSFTYHVGSKLPSGAFKGTFDIGPAGCGPIEFATAGSTCYVKIGAQNGLAATYENTGAGKERSLKVNAAATNLKHTQVSGCSPGEYSNGGWQGTWTVQGSNGFGRVGVHIESTGLPFSVIGTVGTPPQFASEGNPTPITGEKTSTHKLQLQYGKLECTSTKFSATVPGFATALNVSAENSGCVVAGISSVVNMNGCTYTQSVLNKAPVGSTYAGHMDIACPAGKSIEAVVTALGKVRCTITIGAQTTDPEGLSFTNDPSTFTIGVGLEVKGIDYTQQEGEGAGKCSSGSYTNGTYTGTSVLSTVL
jgi:hypothetical protein